MPRKRSMAAFLPCPTVHTPPWNCRFIPGGQGAFSIQVSEIWDQGSGFRCQAVGWVQGFAVKVGGLPKNLSTLAISSPDEGVVFDLLRE